MIVTEQCHDAAREWNRVFYDLVPLGELRDAVVDKVENDHLTWMGAAETCGYVRKDRHGKTRGDGTRLKRLLGVTHQRHAGWGTYTREHLKYDTAVHITRSLGIDPVEVGL